MPPAVSVACLVLAVLGTAVLPSAIAPPVALLLGAGGLALLQLFATGRWPNRREAATDLAVLALMTVLRGDRYGVWQAPEGWGDLLGLSAGGAAAGVGVYLCVAASRLVRGRRHAGVRQAACVLLMPLLFNAVLLLGSEVLMRRLGFWMTGEAAVDDVLRAALGRGLVLLAVGEVLMTALRVLVAGTWPREPRLHLLVVGSALHAAASAPVADLPEIAGPLGPVAQGVAAVICAAVAQSGLWAFVYVMTGLVIDALGVRPPTAATVGKHWQSGWVKGAVFGGTFMGLLLLAGAVLGAPAVKSFALHLPPVAGVVGGALLFPLATTVVGSADETPPFFGRLRHSYGQPRAYWRGAAAGLGAALFLGANLPEAAGLARFAAAFAVGALAYGGVDAAYDAVGTARGRRVVMEAWRIYALGLLLGGCVGGALGWYFDAPQLAVVTAKFWSYVALDGHPPGPYTVYPLFNKWGAIDLGRVGGGTKLFYDESLSGVINWGIAAPLFSINYFVLAALIDRSLSPLKQLLSPKGFEGLVEQAVRVLRWGLWMAPVINSFLRQSPDPAWYNQDGAVRSVAATVAQATLPGGDFRSWSLSVFTGLLAYDWLRVLIWFDHMGLRVATLVNLTFLGGDRADEAAARFAGYAGRTRIMPVGIRRFATWAPLLIPFYIPRGADWDRAWSGAEAVRAHGSRTALPVDSLLLAYALAAAGLLAASVAVAAHWNRRRPDLAAPDAPLAPAPVSRAPNARISLSNGLVTAELGPDGRGHLSVEGPARGGTAIDLTPRNADPLALHGPFVFLRDLDGGATWSLGYEPLHQAGADYRVGRTAPNRATLRNSVAGIRAEAELRLADAAPVEFWHLRLTNAGDRVRRLRVTSFREIVAQDPVLAARDPAFNALHVQTWFVRALNALFVRNRLLRGAGPAVSPETGFHAVRLGVGARLLGYEDSRTRFLGRGGMRNPAGLRPGAPRRPTDEGRLTPFDPAASLTVEVELPARRGAEITFVTGWGRDEYHAAALAAEHAGSGPIATQTFEAIWDSARALSPVPPPPATAFPFAFSAAGDELALTDATPRPWAHVMANAGGSGTIVTNAGEAWSFNGNARQNALTPFRFGSVPAQNPGQLVLVTDLDTGEVDAPGLVPHRRADARHDVTYAPGAATFTKDRGDTGLSLTLFVPPDAPADLRLLTIRNNAARDRVFRVTVCFEMALDESPDDSAGRLVTGRDEAGATLLFNNPFNDFNKGWAFAAVSLDAPAVETVRARFFGAAGRDAANPVMAETGAGDPSREDDGRRVAGFSGLVEVPAGGEAEVAIVLGQADGRAEALALAAQFRDLAAARAALDATRAWWRDRLGAVRVETSDPAFDRLVNTWLPYQVLTAHLWGRAGPDQRGGAYGFRDQLQAVLPLALTDPKLARQQILRHARAQFPEGDVLKWWHATPDGRVALGQRSRASDPHLWLAAVTARYVEMTGDAGLLDEEVPFLEGPAVPDGRIDLVVTPRVSREQASVYDHCRRAVDYALARMGAHGLPLIGSGDWNDGIDAAGAGGRGESTWLALFLHDVLRRFAPLAEVREGAEAGARLRAEAARLKDAVAAAWTGDHFVFVYDDAGERIDPVSLLTAAWPALSGAVDPDRARAALEHGLRTLEKADRVLLLQPAFDEDSHPYPGRIADYPPGVRENGGQYSHGASWTVDAYLWLADAAFRDGERDLAAELRARAWTIWRAVSPLGKTDGAGLATYGLAPHQQPADIYDGPGYAGRGGWSWYTGSAARMLSAAYALVGLEMRNGRVTLAEGAFEPRGALQLRSVTVNGRVWRAAGTPLKTAAQ